MKVSYSLVDGIVKKTFSVAAREESIDWAKKDDVIKEIEREIAHCEEIIRIYNEKKKDAEAKLETINALK